MARSLTTSLLTLVADDERCRRLAALDATEVARLAERLVARDAYDANVPTREALRLAGAAEERALDDHVEHQLWCAWRTARHRVGTADRLRVRTIGAAHARTTDGRPTVLLLPMMLAAADAATVLDDLAGRRPFVIYGEGVTTEHLPLPADRIAAGGIAGLAQILDVLGRGGLFATFADFAYGGHRHETMTLFGRERSLASAYAGLIGRPGVVVLPLCCSRRAGSANDVDVVIAEPWDAAAEPDRTARVAGVAGRLEALIRMAPAQWLLASILTFETPQTDHPTHQPAGVGAMSSSDVTAAPLVRT